MLRTAVSLMVVLARGVLLAEIPPSTASTPPPNVVVMFVDDLGYGDLGCQGNTSLRTPNVDRLADEGVRFTQWISASSICTPSRAALLTGRYAQRMGLSSTDWRFRVLNSPALPGGIPFEEITLAESLKARGYKTGMSGKWHLGIGKEGAYLPTAHGFDSFYGMGCTNVLSCDPNRKLYKTTTLAEFVIRKTPEMWLFITVAVASLHTFSRKINVVSRETFRYIYFLIGLLFVYVYWYTGHMTLVNPLACVLYRDRDIVQQPVQLGNLTQRVTADAQHFIRGAVAEKSPFFLYLPFVKVHTALFANEEFRGRSQSGFYGDNVEEMDWAVGQIMQTLADEGIADNTISFFSSDNGPFLERGLEGGYAGVLRGAKGQNWDGGIRVPGIMHWPGKIQPAIIVDTAVSTMDIFPTTLAIVDSVMNEGGTFAESMHIERDRLLDGKDIRAWVPGLSGNPSDVAKAKSGQAPHDYMFHYCGNEIHAVRIRGRYKLHYATAMVEDDAFRPGSCPDASICGCHNAHRHDTPLIFDVLSDPGETTPLQGLVPDSFCHELIEEAATAIRHHSATINFNEITNQLQVLAQPSLFPCCNKGALGAWPALLHLSDTVCRCDKDEPR